MVYEKCGNCTFTGKGERVIIGVGESMRKIRERERKKERERGRKRHV